VVQVISEGKSTTVSCDPSQYREQALDIGDYLQGKVRIERRGERQGRLTNTSDEVEVEDVANPVDAGDDRDWFFGKMENLSSDPPSLVSGVLNGHNGGKGDAECVGMGRGLWVL
jgi:hypothetical protein